MRSLSCEMTRISDCSSVGSALMRLMSAAPRGVIANKRSSATTFGRRLVITSSACSASTSVNVSNSPLSLVRSLSAGSRSAAPIRTVHEAGVFTLEDLGVLKGPPPHFHFADDVFLRHAPPVAAVGAVIAVIAHHEVVALLHDLRTPVVVAAEFGRDVIVVERDVVDVHVAVDNADRVAFFGDDPFDEHLLRVERIVKHHDVAGTRLAQF